jgi:DNA relaxase NicK
MTFKTGIDWLKFRTLSGPNEALEHLRPAFGTMGSMLFLGDQTKGVDGWQSRKPLMLADLRVGAVDFGGDSQRGWVRWDLPASGCEWVQDWAYMERLPDVLEKPTIKRLDVALTTVDGSVNHDMVIAAHEARQFCTGGRHPHYRVVGGSDPRAGRTIYVGRRDGCKFLRCYEKGFELIKDVPDTLRKHVHSIQMDGHGWSDVTKVYRVEVEFKSGDGYVVPWSSVCSGRDSAFAGAYPFLASLLPGQLPVKMTRLPDLKPRLALASALENCRKSYGGILRAAFEAYGGDMARVWAAVCAEEPSASLVEAGVLTVDHMPKHARETV